MVVPFVVGVAVVGRSVAVVVLGLSAAGGSAALVS
jgi:hypothetical protein